MKEGRGVKGRRKRGGEKEEEGEEEEEIPVSAIKRQGTTKSEASLGCVVSSRQSQLHREALS